MESKYPTIREVISYLHERGKEHRFLERAAVILESRVQELLTLASQDSIREDPENLARHYDRKAFINYLIIVDWCNRSGNERGKQFYEHFNRKWVQARDSAKKLRL